MCVTVCERVNGTSEQCIQAESCCSQLYHSCSICNVYFSSEGVYVFVILVFIITYILQFSVNGDLFNIPTFHIYEEQVFYQFTVSHT